MKESVYECACVCMTVCCMPLLRRRGRIVVIVWMWHLFMTAGLISTSLRVSECEGKKDEVKSEIDFRLRKKNRGRKKERKTR